MMRLHRTLSFVLLLALAVGQPVARAMQDAPFDRLLGQLDGAFSGDQLNLVRVAAGNNTFRSDQVERMLEHLTFASTQLEALAVVADRLEDPENAFTILQAFTFSSDKRAAQGLLSRAKPVPVEAGVITTTPRPVLNQVRYARQGILTVHVRDEAGIDALLRALTDATFARDRLAMIETAARTTDAFTAEQTTRILQTLWFSRDRVDAVHALRYRIIDLEPDDLARILAMVDQDAARLEALAFLVHTLPRGAPMTAVLAAFDFPRNQDEARRMLTHASL